MNVQTSMNTILQSDPPVHIGVDVAKAELVADLQGTIKRYPNTPAGIARLTRAAANIPGAHLVCEATAGYEKALVAAAWKLGIPVSMVPPQRVRQLAKVLGIHAKSDPIDAALISRFGATRFPNPPHQRRKPAPGSIRSCVSATSSWTPSSAKTAATNTTIFLW